MQNQVGKSWFQSSIGRKQLVGLTGVGLSLFVLIHMLGNLLIMVGPRAYNEYSHKLVSNPLIYVAEMGLVVLFLGHLLVALFLTWRNYQARGSRYAVRASGPKRTSWTQRSLYAQGLLVFAFLILHLITFKYGTEYTADYGQGPIRDLHRLALEVFHDPVYVGWYIFAVLILGFHLSHGVGSSFQTLGFNQPRYQRPIHIFSVVYAIVVTAGFVSQPIYVYFIH